MMLFSFIALLSAADPWGRPTHPRIVMKPPESWINLFDESAVFSLWWDKTENLATIEIQGKRRWKKLTTNAAPGWVSPRLPKITIFRITLENATRSSHILELDPTITPAMLSNLSVEKGATLCAVMGEIALDQNGYAFVASLGGGLVKSSDSGLQNITKWDGLPDDRVISVASAEDGRVLVGTAQGAALIQDNSVVRVWDNDLSDSYVQAVSFHQDSLLLGTYRGLDKITDSGVINVLPAWSIFSILAQDSDTVWVGYEGITKLHSDAEPETQTWPGNVYDIISENDQLFLASSEKGVIKVNNEGTQVLHPAQATALTHDGEQLWIAAGEDGLLLENGTRIDGQKALPKTSVWSVAAWKQQLWIGTEEGLYRWSPTSNHIQKFPNYYCYGK